MWCWCCVCTHIIEPFFFRFECDSQNWTFFLNMTQRNSFLFLNMFEIYFIFFLHTQRRDQTDKWLYQLRTAMHHAIHWIKRELSICQSLLCHNLGSSRVLSQIKPQAPLLVVPIRPCLFFMFNVLSALPV